MKGYSKEKEAGQARSSHLDRLFLSVFLVFFGIFFVWQLSKGLGIDRGRNDLNVDSRKLSSISSIKVEILQGGSFINHKNGSLVSLAELRGRPVVVNFWASWCHVCCEEAGEFEMFWQSHNQEDLVVIGVSIDDSVEEPLNEIYEHKLSYLMGLDKGGVLAAAFGITGVPETFFLDRQGVVKHKEIGPVTTRILEAVLPQITN